MKTSNPTAATGLRARILLALKALVPEWRGEVTRGALIAYGRPRIDGRGVTVAAIQSELDALVHDGLVLSEEVGERRHRGNFGIARTTYYRPAGGPK